MGTLQLDIFITQQLNSLVVSYSGFIPVVNFAAEGLGVLTIIGIVLFLFQHNHERIGLANIVVICASGSIAYICALGLKLLVARPRPDLILDGLSEFASYMDAVGSFPSGHATLFAALATAVFSFIAGLEFSYFS